MADILFIYNDRSAHSSYRVGLGIASIAAYIGRRGLTSDLIYYRTDQAPEEVIERVRRADPLAVGFYGPSSGFPTVERLSRLIRQAFPGLFQVYGGPQATLEPALLATTPSLDAVCVGYGEQPVLELLTRLRAGLDANGVSGLWVARHDAGEVEIQENPPWSWAGHEDEILGFDHSLFLRELERLPDFDRAGFGLDVMITRGCVYDCAFCSNQALRRIYGGHIFRPSPAAAIEVLEQALAATGLRYVTFHDEILTANKAWFHEFMDRYRDEIAVPFCCNLRAGSFDEDNVCALRSAGAERVFLGLESGNDFVRNEVMKKGVSRAELERSAELLHRHGIPVVTQNMIGLPHESPASFLDTVRLNARLRADLSILSVFHPYPGTELEQLCRREGLFSERPHGDARERDDTPLELPAFPRRTMRYYRKHFEHYIRYERVRERRPWLPPLTVVTARPIGMATDAFLAVKRAARATTRR